jgi:hypothetical protein
MILLEAMLSSLGAARVCSLLPRGCGIDQTSLAVLPPARSSWLPSWGVTCASAHRHEHRSLGFTCWMAGGGGEVNYTEARGAWVRGKQLSGD